MHEAGTAETLEYSLILMGVLGGLALFLYGMELLTDALKVVAGGGMKGLLARLTTNRFKAAFAGAFVTAVIQSSSVTTVLVVGFISAGLMSLAQSIGVIMGANIGTTITAQIIAFKVTKYSLILVAVGFSAMFFGKRDRIRQYGMMVMGLGLIFFGMELMSEATKPLRSYQPFIDAMRTMDNPIAAVLISAAFTGIVQSSSATTGVIIVLAGQGFITLEAGVALVFGANIGTCVTAALAAIGKPREAVQAAVVHVLFNVLGVVIWFAFIEELAWLAGTLSPTSESLEGAARLAADTPRQIANAHSVFNIANTLIFIPFTTVMARFVAWIVPVRVADDAVIRPKYLDEILIETPALALDRVRMELRRLGERALEMVQKAMPVAAAGSLEELVELARRDDEVDALYDAIVVYLRKLGQRTLTPEQSRLLSRYAASAAHIENIADMIETNIVAAGRERLQRNVTMSEGTREVIRRLHEKLCWAVQLSLEALDASNPEMARQVIEAKTEINRLAAEADAHLASRLVEVEEDRLPLYRIESEMIEYFKRVYYFAKRISKRVADVKEESTLSDVEEPSSG